MAKVPKRSRSRRSSSRFWLTALIFLGVLVLIGVSAMSFVSQHNWTNSGKTPLPDAVTAGLPAANITTAENATPVPAKSDAPDTPAVSKGAAAMLAVVGAYELREGGEKAIENLKSVQMVGTLTVAGRVFDFELIKKAPDRIRIQVEDARGRLIICSDGNQAWLAFRDPKGRVQDWDLDATARDWLWLQVPLGGWLLHPQADGVRLSLGDQQTIVAAGSVSWPVRVSSPGGRTAIYYLDAKENYPKRLELDDPNTTTPVNAADLEDFATLGGVWLPKKLKIRGSSGLEAVLEIKTARFNTGVIDALFQRAAPDETAAATVSASGQGSTASAAMVPPALQDYGFPWPLPW